ncbi:hypothetical protein EV1_005721 [Malus domestica]
MVPFSQANSPWFGRTTARKWLTIFEKNFEEHTDDVDQLILAYCAYDCYMQKELPLLLEKDDEAMEHVKMMENYVMIAMWCIQEDPSLRPTMKKVTQMLEGTVEVSVPPNPSSFFSSIV